MSLLKTKFVLYNEVYVANLPTHNYIIRIIFQITEGEGMFMVPRGCIFYEPATIL